MVHVHEAELITAIAILTKGDYKEYHDTQNDSISIRSTKYISWTSIALNSYSISIQSENIDVRLSVCLPTKVMKMVKDLVATIQEHNESLPPEVAGQMV